MPMFRKKPVVIEAVRVAPPWRKVHLFCQPHGEPVYEANGRTVAFFSIKTLEGRMKAMPGDWIIKGVAGEFYPCKPEIFEATYEALAGEERT